MRELTAKQENVLAVIRRSIEEQGVSPTVREIGREIGVGSTCTVARHIEALERKGHLKRRRYKYRSIELADCPAGGLKTRAELVKRIAVLEREVAARVISDERLAALRSVIEAARIQEEVVAFSDGESAVAELRAHIRVCDGLLQELGR